MDIDIRTTIIQNVINHLVDKIDAGTVNAVQDILTIELNTGKMHRTCYS